MQFKLWNTLLESIFHLIVTPFMMIPYSVWWKKCKLFWAFIMKIFLTFPLKIKLTSISYTSTYWYIMFELKENLKFIHWLWLVSFSPGSLFIEKLENNSRKDTINFSNPLSSLHIFQQLAKHSWITSWSSKQFLTTNKALLKK